MAERNIVLIGMPGSGKSRIGLLLAEVLQRDFLDTDQLIEQHEKMPVAKIFAQYGEAYFRALEAATASVCSDLSGKVIATGGGMVLNPDNIRHLKQNGRVYYLRRELQLLARKGRPLSSSDAAIKTMFQQREPLYLQAADCVVDNQSLPEEAAKRILEDFHENSGD